MNLNLFNNLVNNINENEFVKNFINELNKFLNKNIDNKVKNEYSSYWSYQNFLEDAVAFKIGLSRYGAYITYHNELGQAIDESILEIAKKEETTLYRSKYPANGSTNGQFYNVEKFESGEITNIKISKNDIPEQYQNEDIIFQIEDDGTITVRNDLQEKIINSAKEKVENLKELENEKNNEYKKEGHIYEAIEDDGYVFLKDITEERGFIIEDIDFVVQDYQGEGKYQVIDGKYQMIINYN